MNLVCKLSNALLLLFVEGTLVHTICSDCVAKLSTGHVMQYQTLLTGIDHLTIVKSFKFLCQLSLCSQLL